MLSRLLMVGLVALSFDIGAAEPGADTAVIARTCVTCHHPDNEAIPRLDSLGREDFVARLQALRGSDNTVMHRFLGALDNDMVEALATALKASP